MRLSTLANSHQNHPKDSLVTHHDDVALPLDAKQSLHRNLQSNRKTKLAENVVVCRHLHVDRPEYDRGIKLILGQDYVLITRSSSLTIKSLRTR